MRLAILCLIAAIMLVTAAVARSSSHKEGKRHHQQKAIDLTRQLDRTWNNISTFPTIDEEITRRDQTAINNGGTKKRMKSSSTAANSGGSGGGNNSSGKTNKQDWGKKHKRKMASLLSLAEQDRQLSLLHLPSLPPPKTANGHHTHAYPLEKSSSNGLECCPTMVEMVQPSGGTNMEGHLVELYRHGDLDQRIYEHSCRPDVLNQPCRFVEKLLRPLSRCVQQYSYTYAVVTDHPTGNEWRLDYIRIRNGCACEIQPP